MTEKKKTGLTIKKRSTESKPEAQIIIEGEAWRTTDPDAQATKVDGKYINSFLLRLNPWEIGALSEIAKNEGRSTQQQARLILREALKQVIL